jgi:AraC family transcriptional regulator
MNDTTQEYKNRINRVIDYINANIGRPLSLDVLAGVASFSSFHYHRIFRAMTGETLNDFVRRLRLEKAANMLAVNPRTSVTAVAFTCGFSSSASFARSFKKRFGCSATQWRMRKSLGFSNNCKVISKNGKDRLSGSGYAGNAGADKRPAEEMLSVAVEDMPALRVAYIRHLEGYGNDIGRVFVRLFRWAGPRGLIGPETKVLGIPYDNPEITPAGKCRYDACISVPEGVEAEGEIGVLELKGGKYAVCRFEGNEREIAWTYNALYGNWLPESGYQPDDKPSYEIYYGNPHGYIDVSFVSDICIPVKPL